MTEKQSILGRIAQLCGTDLRALLASTAEPASMLDQVVRDFTATIAETEEAITVSEANLRLAELDRDEDQSMAHAWAVAAQTAWDRGDEVRARDGHSDPTPFDALAESARAKQYAAEGSASSVGSLVAAQQTALSTLQDGLASMRASLQGLKANRQELLTAATSAVVADRVPHSSVNVMDPATDLARFQSLLQVEMGRAFGQPDAAADIEDHLAIEEPQSDRDIEEAALSEDDDSRSSEA